MIPKSRKVLLWISFSVGFALLPLFTNYLDASWKPGGVDLAHVVDRGELFLVAAALCADGVGRMWGSRNGGLATVVFVACFWILFASSIEFAMVARALNEGIKLTPKQVQDSIWVFEGAVVAALFAVIIE